jgi:hypothetical protein
MQELSDLLGSPAGLEFLSSNQVFVNQEAFTDAVQAPLSSELAALLGIDDSQRLICAGQQLYLDYRQSIVNKLNQLNALEQDDTVETCFLWHDTDRSAADPLMNKFLWHMNGKEYPLRVAPPKTNEVEARFVILEPAILEQVMNTMRNYLFQSPVKDKEFTKQRYDQLGALFLGGGGMSLSQFNLQITQLLLEEVLHLKPKAIMLSTVLDQGLLTAEINRCLNQLDDFIRVFNEGVAALVEQDINPQVRPLPEDYFPLHYSSPTDGQRIRLRHKVEGNEHFAFGQGADGENYSFSLGSQELSIEEIAVTGRWSPDVTFPIFLNEMVSGYVMGKSSALYGIVMRDVMMKVLDKKPVPFLVPPTPPQSSPESIAPDSLMRQFLMGE